MAGLVVLKAYRDSLDKKADNNLWHYSGFAMLVWVCFWGLLLVFPFSLMLFKVMFLVGAITWIVFDVVYNLFAGNNWWHIGNSWIERTLKGYIYVVKLSVLIISISCLIH
jgi:hypothetical protein